MKKLLFCSLLLLSSLSFATAINEDNFLTELEGARFNHGAPVNSIAWLACGGKKYIALGGDTSGANPNEVRLRLLEFDIFNNSVSEFAGGVDTQHGANVNSVAWLKCEGKKYLATGGVSADTLTTRIYRFSESNTQLQFKSGVNNASDVNSVAWIDCGASGKWLAEGANTGGNNQVAVRQLNTQTEVLGAVVAGIVDHAQNVNSVAWCVANNKKFLAIGGAADAMITTRLYVLDFDGGASLDLQMSANQMHGATVNAVDWVDCNGTKYLVTAGENSTDDIVIRVYRLDAGDTPSLTQVDTFANEGSDAISVHWLNCGGTKYIAYGSEDSGTNPVDGCVVILKFDSESETLEEVTDFDHDESVKSVTWLQCGALTYLALGGTTQDNITNRVFEVDFDDDATNKLLREKFFQLHGNNAPDVPFLNVPVVIQNNP